MDDIIARFILDKDYFNIPKNRVKPGAFKLSGTYTNLSVYRITNCKESKIWSLAYKFVSCLRKDKKAVIARADLPAEFFLKENLKIQLNPIPHHRHAELTNWPSEKAQQLRIAVTLANEAKLVLPLVITTR